MYFDRLDVRPSALSDAVSFPLCIGEARGDVVTFASTCSADGRTSIEIVVGESTFSTPLGTLTVPVNQSLALQAMMPTQFNGHFDVHGSLNATALILPASTEDDDIFSGSGQLRLQDCYTVDGDGKTTPLGVACVRLSLSHGQLSGDCEGLLNNQCSFVSCDDGYEMSGSDGTQMGGTVTCEIGGVWSDTLPTCVPRSCAPVTISHSDRLDDNRCTGTTGDSCDFFCDPGFSRYGTHVCQADGRFAGGTCRPDEHCFDDPSWRDTAGEAC